MKVMILAGGLSHERDVSIRSGRRVREELEDRGIKATVHDVDTTLLPNLRSLRDTVVWPLLHGASGEDGSIQALLELVDAPFVGTGSREARVAWVKPVAKAVFARSPSRCSGRSAPSTCCPPSCPSSPSHSWSSQRGVGPRSECHSSPRSPRSRKPWSTASPTATRP